jgi:hypothetical protein
MPVSRSAGRGLSTNARTYSVAAMVEQYSAMRVLRSTAARAYPARVVSARKVVSPPCLYGRPRANGYSGINPRRPQTRGHVVGDRSTVRDRPLAGGTPANRGRSCIRLAAARADRRVNRRVRTPAVNALLSAGKGASADLLNVVRAPLAISPGRPTVAGGGGRFVTRQAIRPTGGRAA